MKHAFLDFPTYIKTLGLIFFVFLLFLAHRSNAQPGYSYIGEYLSSSDFLSFNLPKGGPIRKDFTQFSDVKKLINFKNRRHLIVLHQFSASNKTLQFGKTKIGIDSMFYIKLSIGDKGHWFEIKKPFSIKLIGYTIFRGDVNPWFKLSSKENWFYFDISKSASRMLFGQVDALR